MNWFVAIAIVGNFTLMAGELPGVPDQDWDALFTRTEGWTGGDAMYSLDIGNGTVLWLFADTWIGTVKDGQHVPGAQLVNNSLGRHPLRSDHKAPPYNDIEFLWRINSKDAKPIAWIEPTVSQADEKVWYWVADGIVHDSREGNPCLSIFLWRMGSTSDNGVFGFKSVGGAIATINNPHSDWTTWNPKQFDNPHAIPSGDSANRPETSWGSELIFDPDDTNYILVYGVREGAQKEKELVVARAPADAIEQFEEWKFKSKAAWAQRPENATAIATGLVNEFSITPVTTNGQTNWILVQSEPFFGPHILVRSAASPFGPWSKSQKVYRVHELKNNAEYFTYAAKAHPELSRPGELLLTYVVNSFDFGAMFRDASIYRPRFVRLPLKAIELP